jgi:dipeptidyl aminopeptidase/acylaminoacyl peptidase
VFTALAVAIVTMSLAPANSQDAPQQKKKGFGPRTEIPNSKLTPHWFADDSKFWYRNALKGGGKEFIVVDADTGKRGPAFDHAKLAESLSKAANEAFRSDRLPFNEIELTNDGKTLRFEAAGKAWKCDLEKYDCTAIGPAAKRPSAKEPEPTDDPESPEVSELQPERQPKGKFPERSRDAASPDGKWVAFIKDSNVFLRPTDGGDSIQLSKTGVEGNAFGMLSWSADSKALVGFRIEPAEAKDVYRVDSSPMGGGRAKLVTQSYPLPGDKFTAYEPWVFDIAKQSAVKLETDRIDFGRPRLRWNKDGRHFTYEKVDRGHQRYRLVEVDSHTGKLRNLIDEKTDTFIWTQHYENVNMPTVTWLEKSSELIYVSEKDGWRHLYLLDAASGEQKHEITKGNYVVRGIDRIDEDKRQIWFRACGKNADQDPYFIHHYRVNFDGSDLVALTDANGTHSVQFSPKRKYLVDSYSRVDLPPVHELRRCTDGTLVCKLEEVDVADQKASGWEPPEVFVAKGRDGTTDIWGIIARPRNFDAKKTYPVIESIYAGPQGSFVPKSFAPGRRFSNLTDLGFIVVQIDGMGTANRSKKFHDVCWKNLKDAGFLDRILWHKEVAKKYPYYDISRVGIYGGSAGGQNSTAGVLFHPDFYKVAVSGCGCHDNRMDKASWNEQWMGYPVGPQYSACSNIDNAYRLKGKLLLIVGELDNNVPPEST